jgi:hypothetical protein
MLKILSFLSLLIVVACSSGLPKCDDSSIKNILEKNIKEAIEKTFHTSDVAIKLSSLKNNGIKDDKRMCEADVSVKIKNAKYVTKSTATLEI